VLRTEDGADEDVHLRHRVGAEPAYAGEPGFRGVAAGLTVNDARAAGVPIVGVIVRPNRAFSVSQVSFTPRPVLVPP